MATGPAYRREQHISTDRETIRNWAGRHNAVPVRGRSDGTLDLVHESRVGAEYKRVDWDTFYDELEHESQAVSYRMDGLETPEVMTHEQAVSRNDIEDKQIRDRLVAGETVTSTIHETSAVETPVIEEATVESELVHREVIHEELLDVDLVERVCTDVTLVRSDDFVDADTFDHGRYFASLEASRDESARGIERSDVDSESRSWVATRTEPSLPATAEIDVRQVWTPSREITERFTVESRITGTDVTEAERIEDYNLDVTGLQRSIIEQGMLNVEHDPDEAMRDFEIESELGEGDQIHTHFTRTSVIEDEVIDQIRAYADIDRADFAEMDFTASDHLVSEEATEAMRSEPGGVSLTSDDIGKGVVEARGNKVGTVQEITDGGQTAYVEPHSSITERVMSALSGSDEDGRAMEIYVGQLAGVTHEELRLKEYEQLAENRRSNGGD